MFADTRFRYLEGMRQVVADRRCIRCSARCSCPARRSSWVGSYFASKRALADENAALKQDLVAQAPSRRRFDRHARRERSACARCSSMQKRYAGAATAVEVLYTGRDPFTQKVFVNHGSDAGIRAGEAVIDELGVVGQVTRVFPVMAEVTLVTDKDHAVPVKVERSGVRSVLFGAGAGRLARAALHGADRRHQAGRPARHVRDRRHLSARTRRGAGGRPSTATPARCSRASPCRPLAGVDRSAYLLVLRTGRRAAAASRRAGRRRRVKKGAARRRSEMTRTLTAFAAPKGAIARLMAARRRASEHASPIRRVHARPPEEILRPVHPWFILLTLVLGAARRTCRPRPA